MPQPIRVLVVEDSEDDALLLIRHLRCEGFEPTHLRVDTGDALASAFDSAEWDVVLCDYRMPQLQFPTVARELARRGLDIPCIVLSGAIGEAKLVEFMKAGAQDVILKDNLVRLGPAIRREVDEAHERGRVRKSNEKLIAHLSQHDPLTGLPNRALLNDRLQQAILTVKRSRCFGAVVFIDLDHFKDVNDTLGHPVGDELLKTVADRLRACARESDTVARLGGDEFALIVGNLDEAAGAAEIAERVLDKMSKPISADGHLIDVGASIGIAVFPADGSDVTALLRNADLALYRAKSRGRRRYQFYSRDMGADVEHRKALEQELHAGLRDGAFFLSYLPLVDLRSGQSTGVEALLRLLRPGVGIVLPEVFLPVAERSGLILMLGEWVLRTACAQFRAWRDDGLAIRRLAINVSVAQLNDITFVHQVESALRAYAIDGESLELEVSETAIMYQWERVCPQMLALHDLGVRFAIDDFGTGYSSLVALKSLPVSRLKIDRSFVRELMAEGEDSAVARGVLGLAQSFGWPVVAEGVETEGQMEWVHRLGCSELQGYYFGRPISGVEFAKWARSWNGAGGGPVPPGVRRASRSMPGGEETRPNRIQ